MRRTRQQLDSMLERLEDNLPSLIQTCGEDSFMETFARQADLIENSAGPGDRDYVKGRIDCMLSSRCLGPDDDQRPGLVSETLL